MSKPLTNTTGSAYSSDEHKKADIDFVVDKILRAIAMGHAEFSGKVHDGRVVGCKVTQGWVNKI